MDINQVFRSNAATLQTRKKKPGGADSSFSSFIQKSMLEAAEAKKNRQEQPAAVKKKMPYEHLINEDDMIVYNGVAFTCDYEKNAICLGDMSNPDNVLTISLSGGGSLRVNRDNINELTRAIGMFSAADRNLIMRAIALDAKVEKMKQELEDTKSKVGEDEPVDGNSME